jgi:hypothetical protein
MSYNRIIKLLIGRIPMLNVIKKVASISSTSAKLAVMAIACGMAAKGSVIFIKAILTKCEEKN